MDTTVVSRSQKTNHAGSMTPEDVALLHSFSDADLVQYSQRCPRLANNNHIYLLSADLISKGCRTTDIQAAIRAMGIATELGIRVPAVKRIVTFDGYSYIIMQRIDGTTLEEAWPKLSWLATFKIAFQLRNYIRLMRSLTSSTAGSPISGESRSFYLEDHFMLPPHSSPEVLTSFIRFWTTFKTIGHAMKSASQEPLPLPPKTYIKATAKTLVFTHHDLAPRNLQLDGSRQLWLLDWDYAGWYPKYFEYAAMQNFKVPEVWGKFARVRWALFSWITVGRFEKERTVLERVRSKFTRFAVGRRFAIIAGKSPSARPALLD